MPRANQPSYEELENRIKELEYKLLKAEQANLNLKERVYITNQEKAEHSLKEKEHQLTERIKELTGIYLLEILTQKHNNPDYVYSEFVKNILPPSMQFPEKVYVSLEIEDKRYSNLENHILPENKKYLSSPIVLFKKKAGKLIVAYTEDLPFIEPYEPRLLNVYAGLISKNSERFKTINAFKDKAEKSEEKYHLIAENSNDIIWILDIKTFKFTYFSPSVFTISGFSVEESLQMSFTEIFTPETSDIFLQELPERIEKIRSGDLSTKSKEYQFQRVCKDNSLKWVEVSTTLRMDNEGNINDLVGVARNIETRKKNELIIQRQNEELKKLNSDKDRFLQIIAHDLKNPFQSLLGFSDMLLNNMHKYSIDRIESQVKIIHQAAHETYNFLVNLLLWSKTQSGKLNFDTQNIIFREVCDEIISNLKNHAQLKDISLSCLESDNIVVTADLNMLKTVLRNLISNAIKFTNRNGQIKIYTEENSNTITITVSDNGVGIKNEKLQELWDFTKSTSTKGTENEKGTGLGLLICKEIVEKNGGRIWVESELGKGSDFKFTIPLNNK